MNPVQIYADNVGHDHATACQAIWNEAFQAGRESMDLQLTALVEAPVVEAPVVEAPVVEAPVVEEPAV